MDLSKFKKFSRMDALKDYKKLRYIKNNTSYFLYLIFDAGSCVYVGETSNIFWRVVKHKAKFTPKSVIYFQEYSDKAFALKQEKHFIQMLKPKFNNRYCALNQLEMFSMNLKE